MFLCLESEGFLDEDLRFLFEFSLADPSRLPAPLCETFFFLDNWDSVCLTYWHWPLLDSDLMDLYFFSFDCIDQRNLRYLTSLHFPSGVPSCLWGGSWVAPQTSKLWDVSSVFCKKYHESCRNWVVTVVTDTMYFSLSSQMLVLVDNDRCCISKSWLHIPLHVYNLNNSYIGFRAEPMNKNMDVCQLFKKTNTSSLQLHLVIDFFYLALWVEQILLMVRLFEF